jgi:hypothetical protein
MLASTHVCNPHPALHHNQFKNLPINLLFLLASHYYATLKEFPCPCIWLYYVNNKLFLPMLCDSSSDHCELATKSLLASAA